MKCAEDNASKNIALKHFVSSLIKKQAYKSHFTGKDSKGFTAEMQHIFHK